MIFPCSHWEWCWKRIRVIGWRRSRCGAKMPSTRWSWPWQWEWLWYWWRSYLIPPNSYLKPMPHSHYSYTHTVSDPVQLLWQVSSCPWPRHRGQGRPQSHGACSWRIFGEKMKTWRNFPNKKVLKKLNVNRQTKKRDSSKWKKKGNSPKFDYSLYPIEPSLPSPLP